MSDPIVAEIMTNPEIEQEARDWQNLACDFAVETAGDAEYAGSMMPRLRAAQDRVREFFHPALEAAREAKRKTEAALAELRKLEEQMLEPFVTVERRFKGQVAAWVGKQEADRQRVIAANNQREREAREERGRQERAQRELEEQARKANRPAPVPLPVPAPVPAPALLPPPAAIVGMQVRKVHTAQVTDLKMLVQAIARGEAPLELVLADQKKLNALATNGFEAPPGVIFETTTVVAHEARGRNKK